MVENLIYDGVNDLWIFLFPNRKSVVVTKDGEIFVRSDIKRVFDDIECGLQYFLDNVNLPEFLNNLKTMEEI